LYCGWLFVLLENRLSVFGERTVVSENVLLLLGVRILKRKPDNRCRCSAVVVFVCSWFVVVVCGVCADGKERPPDPCCRRRRSATRTRHGSCGGSFRVLVLLLLRVRFGL
jgi:hypothetical protein